MSYILSKWSNLMPTVQGQCREAQMNIYTFYYIKISWKSLFLESCQRTKLYILVFQIRETLDLAFGAGLQLTADIPRIGKYRMKWQGERIASSDYENETCKDTDEECAGRGGICKSIPKTDKAHNKMKKLNSEKVCSYDQNSLRGLKKVNLFPTDPSWNNYLHALKFKQKI